MKNNDMEDLLNNFKKKEINPTAAIIEPTEEEKKDSDKLSKLVKKKERMENTHTRRTFLVKNELLQELDSFADKINNTGFKTKFINYVIDKGLSELKNIDEEN